MDNDKQAAYMAFVLLIALMTVTNACSDVSYLHNRNRKVERGSYRIGWFQKPDNRTLQWEVNP